MNKHKNQAGFSIPDMLVGLSIVAVAIVGVLYAQRSYVRQADVIEIRSRATTLANSVMSTIRMHRYDENTDEPWSATLGANSGETSTADYDDVDDYAAASWNFSALGYPNFTVSTRVFYVDIQNSWLDSVGGPTSYKRIIVSVDHDVLDRPLVISTLAAGGY